MKQKSPNPKSNPNPMTPKRIQKREATKSKGLGNLNKNNHHPTSSIAMKKWRRFSLNLQGLKLRRANLL
jgi:hypothetical protein